MMCRWSVPTLPQMSRRLKPAKRAASSRDTTSTSLEHIGHQATVAPAGRLTVTVWCISIVVTVLFLTKVPLKSFPNPQSDPANAAINFHAWIIDGRALAPAKVAMRHDSAAANGVQSFIALSVFDHARKIGAGYTTHDVISDNIPSSIDAKRPRQGRSRVMDRGVGLSGF